MRGMAAQSPSPAAVAAVVALKCFLYACRAKAKKALHKLAKDHPKSPLPHRFLVSLPSQLSPYVNA